MSKLLSSAGLLVLVTLLSVQVTSAQVYTKLVTPDRGDVSLTIGHSGFSLTALSLRTLQNEGFTIAVERVDSDEEWVYEYFIIDAIGLVKDEYAVVFDLKVSKEWIESNNVERNTIGLNIFDDEWTRIEVRKQGEDDRFIYYTANVPKLEAVFAVTGEPIPFKFRVTSHCNGNDVCEPEEGETQENCGDCLNRVTSDICVPFKVSCAGNYLMECNSGGTDYELTPCDFGCSDGACTTPDPLPAAGMFISQNPVYFAVIALLSSIIAYLVFTLRRTKEALIRVEKIATSQDNIRTIAERKD
jgi:hypothetical protein